jgi:hypothetical protein
MPGSLSSAIAALKRVITNRDTRRAETAWTLSYAAEWSWLVALFVYAFGVGGVGAVGLVGLVRTLPAAFLAPALSSITDELPRHRVLLCIHLTRALLVALAAVSVGLAWPPLVIFAIAPLDGLLAVLHRPTHMALMPSLARAPEELVASNVASSTLEGLGTLVGPAVGGVLVAIGLGPVAFAVPAAGFALAATAVFGIKPAQRLRRVRAPIGPGVLFGGLGAIRDHPHAGFLLGLFGAQILVRGVLNVLLVAASVELLGLGEEGLGYLSAALGAGGFLGAVFAMALVSRPRMAPSVAQGLVMWGTPILVIGLVPSAPIAFGALALVGAGNAVLDVSGFTLLQRTVPNDERGRVFGLLEALVMLGLGVGAALAPVLVSVLGVRGSLIAAGALLPAVAAVSWPHLRRIDALGVIPEQEMNILRGVPMFRLLPLTVLEQVAGVVETVTYPSGTTIITEGDIGDRFYVLVDGAAEASVGGRLMAQMEAGDSFGEIALLHRVPRTASVVARTPTTAYAIDCEAFRAAVAGDRQSLAAAEAIIDTRLAASP